MNVLSSPNPQDRERAVRRVVRRLLAEHSLSVAELARRLGRSRQRLERQLADDGDASLKLADLLVIEAAVPGLLAELAGACNLEVRPCEAADGKMDVLHAATQAMRAATDAGAEALDAIADDRITPAEAEDVRRLLRATRVSLSKLEASFEAAGRRLQ